ncbi:MAG: DUF6134 family protein [Rhodospirillaceae bacterium]|nr:DUF6134 family protein [Rhodospirillaceae bacterium]
MQYSKKLISTAGAFALVLTLALQPVVTSAKTLSYTVLRNGSPIGTHNYILNSNGDETTVSINTDIKVKIFFATVYEFLHSSVEKWKGGMLVSIQSTTNDDGTPKELNVKGSGSALLINAKVKGAARNSKAPATSIPASLWNKEIISQSRLLNTLDGKIMKVKIDNLGVETVPSNGGNEQATHYKISGELTRELWFNANGDLVRVRFPADDKSEIIYALK